MAWVPLDDDDSIGDDEFLHSALGVRLAENAEHVYANRLKRHAQTFYLGPTSSGGGTPPAGDSTVVGPTVEVRGSSTSDAEAISLRVSSPPTTPLVLDLGHWPLSAGATSLRVVVGCATEEANVDLYAFASVYGGVEPVSERDALTVDSDGVVSFSEEVTGSTAHVSVGTSSPSGSQDVKPVVLTVDLGGRDGYDYGAQEPSDSRRGCRVFLAILSSIGSLDSALSQAGIASVAEDGRRIVTDAPLSTWSQNPGPFHRWIQFQDVSTEVESGSSGWVGRTVGALQLRPNSTTTLASADAAIVIHPPIPADSVVRLAEDINIYMCGVIRIDAVSVQEVSS
jgi:hypothetical protein